MTVLSRAGARAGGGRTVPVVIGLCTDSNAQLSPLLIERFGVVVVPVTISIDGVEYLEGVDLGAEEFYARLADGTTPEMSTVPPSAGQFALAYEQLAARGCTEILSIHVGSALSGMLNAARLASRSVDLPVQTVDTGTAGFGVGCCVWAAADAIGRGAGLEEAAAAAERTAGNLGSAFVLPGSVAPGDPGDRVPIFSLSDGGVVPFGSADDLDGAVRCIVGGIPTDRGPINLAIGMADSADVALSDALASAGARHEWVSEVVRYRIGASIAIHVGPGVVAAFWYPVS